MLLVAGITGHSGRWFLKNLETDKYAGKIRCLVRASSDIEFLEKSPLDIELCYGDLTDEAFLDKSFKGITTAINIAGIRYSEKFVAAGAKHNVEWFILVHTTGRFSKFKSASAGYIKIENELTAAHDNLTILRPTIIYGSSMDRNLWKLVKFLDKYPVFPVFGNGKNLMQPVHAKDLGDAYFQVLNNKAKTLNKQYDLSGKEAIPYKELLQTVSRQLGKKTLFFHLPISVCIFLAKVYNFILPKHALVKVEQVMRMNEDKAFSHAAAAKDFGYSPVAFKDGIVGEVAEYLATK